MLSCQSCLTSSTPSPSSRPISWPGRRPLSRLNTAHSANVSYAILFSMLTVQLVSMMVAVVLMDGMSVPLPALPVTSAVTNVSTGSYIHIKAMIPHTPAHFLISSICCCNSLTHRAIPFMYAAYIKARIALRTQKLSVLPVLSCGFQVCPHTAHAGPAAGSRILPAVRAVCLGCEDFGPGHLLHARAAPGLCHCSSRSVFVYSVIL